MKKILKIIGIIAGVLITITIIMIIVFTSMARNWEFPDDSFAEINLENIEDGSYQGEYHITPLKAIVTVHIENNTITNIILEEHKHGRGEKAEEILAEIIYRQSLEVDTITGATHSSNAIRKAIEDALVK